MTIERAESFRIDGATDIVRARQVAREWSVQLGFSLVDQTKIVTAASELARNTVDHGGGGTMHLESLRDGARSGIRMTFEDRGPGIASIEDALRDGFTTGGGLGLGLSGSKRLMSEFDLTSEPGNGTRVVATRWRV